MRELGEQALRVWHETLRTPRWLLLVHPVNMASRSGGPQPHLPRLELVGPILSVLDLLVGKRTCAKVSRPAPRGFHSGEVYPKIIRASRCLTFPILTLPVALIEPALQTPLMAAVWQRGVPGIERNKAGSTLA